MAATRPVDVRAFLAEMGELDRRQPAPPPAKASEREKVSAKASPTPVRAPAVPRPTLAPPRPAPRPLARPLATRATAAATKDALAAAVTMASPQAPIDLDFTPPSVPMLIEPEAEIVAVRAMNPPAPSLPLSESASAPEPERIAGPGWVLPPRVIVTVSAPSERPRSEHPSFGAVAFDVRDSIVDSTTVRIRRRASNGSMPRTIATAAGVAILLSIGAVVLRTSVHAAAPIPIAAAAASVAPPSSIDPTSAAADSALARPVATAVASVDSAASAARLTPEMLFPKDSESVAPRPQNLSPAEYRRQKSALAADLARRNRVEAAPMMGGRRSSPLGVDELMRLGLDRVHGESD